MLLFVGYCDDRKAYRFLDLKTNVITVSRAARFIALSGGSLMARDLVPDGSETDSVVADGSDTESIDEGVVIQEETVVEYP